MTGDTIAGAPALLAPVRAWARRRHPHSDLSWVAPGFLDQAEAERFRRHDGDGERPERFSGIGLRLGAPELLRLAAQRADEAGQPTGMLALDLLFLPFEYAIASRDAWWGLGTRRDVVDLIFEAFGIAEVASGADDALVEQLLAWLRHYIPGRGTGPTARKLLELIDARQSRRWFQLPGEPLTPSTPAAERVQLELDSGEVQAVRSLAWHARRRAGDSAATPSLRIAGGLLRGTSVAPRLAPEDAVIRLGSSEGSSLQPRTLRILPPWTNLRYLPSTEVESR